MSKTRLIMAGAAVKIIGSDMEEVGSIPTTINKLRLLIDEDLSLLRKVNGKDKA